MKHFITCMAMFIPILSLAQIPDYYADFVNGDITLIKKNKKGIPLKSKTFIYKDDILIVKEKSEVTLINKDDRYIVLKEAGTYNESGRKKLLPQKASTITEKYFDMAREELKNPSSAAISVDNIVSSFGGVSRSMCNMQMFPLKGWATMKDSLKFTWALQDTCLYYTFLLKNSDKEIILRSIVKDTQLIINKMSINATSEAEYYWSVASTYAPCGHEPEYKFTWLSKKIYNDRLQKILLPLNNDSTTHYYLQAAQELMNNCFYETAGEYLKKALSAN